MWTSRPLGHATRTTTMMTVLDDFFSTSSPSFSLSSSSSSGCPQRKRSSGSERSPRLRSRLKVFFFRLAASVEHVFLLSEKRSNDGRGLLYSITLHTGGSCTHFSLQLPPEHLCTSSSSTFWRQLYNVRLVSWRSIQVWTAREGGFPSLLPFRGR